MWLQKQAGSQDFVVYLETWYCIIPKYDISKRNEESLYTDLFILAFSSWLLVIIFLPSLVACCDWCCCHNLEPNMYSTYRGRLFYKIMMQALAKHLYGIISVCISGRRNYYLYTDYCLCYRNISAVVPTGLHQVFVGLGNLQGISNWTLCLIYGGGLFSFC